MGIVSSLFTKPVRKALTKSVAKQTDDVVPKIAAEVADPVVADAPLPTKSLVTKKARGSTSKPVIKEEPVVTPQDDVDTGVNFDPLFKDEASPASVVDDAFTPPKVDRTEDFGIEPELIAESGTDAFEALGLSAEKKEVWRKQNKASQRSKLLPEIEEAAQKLFEGKLKPEEFRKLSAEKQPIVPLDKVPDMPSFTDIAGALTPEQVNKGIVGLNMKIAPGERVSSRLDIPAYNDYNTWVVSLHEGTTKSGAPIGYAKTAVLKNVEFMSDPKVALDIARRKPLVSGKRMGKATIARIFGDYVPHDPDAAKAYAEKIFNDPEWTQVGMNPYRASYFYDKTDHMPVVSADEIVQIGPLVMAKNVKKTKPDDAIFRVNKKDDASPTFAKGGVVENEMNKLFAEGGVMQEGGTVDPVSGNEVPPGAMAEEVRDDIPAQLSEGEFVFPADVVRFYGLEKLMMMRDKAKMGLKRMNDIGQMGNAEEVEDGEALFGGEDMDDDAFSSEIDSIMAEDSGGETREYNAGGYVAPQNQQKYSRTSMKGFEMVPMVNDAGQTIFIPFINGVAQLGIPTGYRVKESGAAEPPTAPDAPTTGGDIGGGGGDGGGDGGPSGNVGGGGGLTSGPGFSIGDDGLAVADEMSGKTASRVGSILGMTVLGPLGMLAGSKAGKYFAEKSNFDAQQAAMNFNVAVSDTTAAANNEGVTTAAATTGTSGTGGSAANAAAAAASAAASNGLSAAAQGAASQAAASAVVSGKSASEAAAAGAAAAADIAMSDAVNDAAAQEAAAGFDAPSWDAGQPNYGGGDSGGGYSGDNGGGYGDVDSGGYDGPGSGGYYAKGGLVKKRINKKTAKSTSFVTRPK